MRAGRACQQISYGTRLVSNLLSAIFCRKNFADSCQHSADHALLSTSASRTSTMARVYIFTGNQVLQLGLEFVGFPLERQQRQKRSSNIDDFEAHYGVHPVIIAQIWEDLQRTLIAAARICASPPWVTNGMVSIKNMLHAFHFLKRYQTESERKGTTGYSKPTLRTWCWYFVEKIQALKAAKVSMFYAIMQAIFLFCKTF